MNLTYSPEARLDAGHEDINDTGHWDGANARARRLQSKRRRQLDHKLERELAPADLTTEVWVAGDAA